MSSMPTSTRILRASWSSTLQLPKSRFPPRPLPVDRPKYLQRCTDDLYAWQQKTARVSPRTPFVLHDGPPYANGSLHVGHALNKILKDITCRFQLLQGNEVNFVPGWDCHGLPIEMKALQQQKGVGISKDGALLPPSTVRGLARELASRTVEEQKREFKRWAIMADWDNAWKTMDQKFELRQLDVFKRMLEKGLIYRSFKPVYWSPSSRTALAEAELEYRSDHESLTAFIKFPMVDLPETVDRDLRKQILRASLLIWTTTPWTLLANKAIAVHSDLEYVIVQSAKDGFLLIARSRLSEVGRLCNENFDTTNVRVFQGSQLVGGTYRYPASGLPFSNQPILHADFVSVDSGTGLVHIAPGHGMDDYKLCQQHDIDAFAPIDDAGCFTRDLLPEYREALAGKSVLGDGNQAVLDLLEQKGLVLRTFNYKHKFPYDWRSKQPVVVRATEQWFADVGEIRDDALLSLEKINFIPAGGKERLASFVRNRSEWCISRQRAWGVPIPALYRVDTGEALLTPDSVSHIIKVLQNRGSDAWWTDDDLDPIWTPPELQGVAQYRRGKDTMDVWFDSGTSWSEINGDGMHEPVADVNLEGSDQHRGWFQSSLLTRIACQPASQLSATPFAQCKTLVTHGFTLDQYGKKMSKSEGNIVSPDEIMNGTLLPPIKRKLPKGLAGKPLPVVHDAMGADALRLWVAGCDYTKDVTVGVPVLKAVNGSLSKLRVTFRHLLGLLNDYLPTEHVTFRKLGWIDQLALIQLRDLRKTVHDHFVAFNYHQATAAINSYVITDLSAFYMESIKDRMYVDGLGSPARLHAQMVLWEIFKELARMLTPITPLLMEEVYDYLPNQLEFHAIKQAWRVSRVSSVGIEDTWKNSRLEEDSSALFMINTAVKSAQELARLERKMGSSLQSSVLILFPEFYQNNDVMERLIGYLDGLSELLVVSQVAVRSTELSHTLDSSAWSYSTECTFQGQKLAIHVRAPEGEKCGRCWKYTVPVDLGLDEPLCGRCIGVLDGAKDDLPVDLAEFLSLANGKLKTSEHFVKRVDNMECSAPLDT